MKRSWRTMLVRTSVLLAVLLTFAARSRAQIPQLTDVTSTPIPGAGHSYIHDMAETVNPANGSVSVRISIPLPPGRGLTLPFSIAYDSDGAHFIIGKTGGNGLLWGTNGSTWANGGWSYTVPTLSMGEVTVPYENGTCGAITNYLYQDPSGGRHSLDLSVIGVVSGKGLDCANSGLGAVTTGGEGPLLATTTSGSGTGSLCVTPVTTTDPDGTTTHFATTCAALPYPAAYVEDRNGNKVTINATPLSSSAVSYTDTLGRTALSASGFDAANPDTIAVSGMSQPYKVYWGTANWNYNVNLSPIDNNGPSGAFNNTGSRPAITEILLPNGQSFQFQYDSTYGLLDKITYPSGGYVTYSWGLALGEEAGTWMKSWCNGLCNAEEVYDLPVITDRCVYDDVNGTITEVEHQHFTYTQPTWNPSDPTAWTSRGTTVTTDDLVDGVTSTKVYKYGPYDPGPQPNDSSLLATEIPEEDSIQTQDGSGRTLRTVTETW